MPAQDPKSISINKSARQLKVNKKGVFVAIIRSVFDATKSSLGAGTIPEWVKAINIESDAERQAFQLVAESLIKALREQLHFEREQAFPETEDKIYYANKLLDFKIFQALEEGDYYLNCDILNNPAALPLLKDFKGYYQQWLQDSFAMSLGKARLFAAGFTDYFADAFLQLLNPSKHDKILAICENPILERQRIEMARRRYRSEIKSLYHRPVLGLTELAVSDVYIEPSFKVYQKLLNDEHCEAYKEKFKHQLDNTDFLPTAYPHSLTTYFRHHFLEEKPSAEINAEEEASRLMILLGQPGHGKSTFCYRMINDLLENPDFSGNCFFVKLNHADKKILSQPLDEIEHLFIKKRIDFKNWINPSYQQKTVLFLDGLDELFMAQSLSDKDVLSLCHQCNRLLQNNPHLYIVITSRFNYVESNELYNINTLLLSLGDLQNDQQEEMRQRFYKKVKQEKAIRISKALFKKVHEDDELDYLKELIKLPVLLQMVLIAGKSMLESTKKAELYQKLFDYVLNRKWSEDKRLKKYKKKSDFKLENLRDYISLLAFKTFQSKKGYLQKYDIEQLPETKQFIRRHLKISIDHGNEGIRDVLKDLLTSFYLQEKPKEEDHPRSLDQHNEYAIEFLHKSLYEYLACEYLWKNIKNFFLDNEGHNRYQAFKETLKKVQYWFGNTTLTEETAGYLREMIDKDPENHEPLADAMAEHLPDLLDYGFLDEWKADEKASDIRPQDRIINAFRGYWLVLGRLGYYQLNDWPEGYWNWDAKEFWTYTNNKIDWIALKSHHTKAYETDIKHAKKHWNADSLVPAVEKWTKEREHAIAAWQQTDTPHEITSNHLLSWIKRVFFKHSQSSITMISSDAIQRKPRLFGEILRLSASQAYSFPFHLSLLNLTKLPLNNWVGWSSNLLGTDLSSAVLRSADLRSADLRFADLRFADLRFADLRSAVLRFANLRNADLSSAVLRSADLRFAVLRSADLRFAVLRDANLSSADLRSADLRDANLRNARVESSEWIKQLEKSNVRGIDYIKATYVVGKEKKTFENILHGYEYEAYEIIPINEANQKED